MPQLDTIHILMVFLWTWLIMHLMLQKIKTIPITKMPKIVLTMKTRSKLTLPWT